MRTFAVLVLALAPAIDTLKPVDVVCPIDGTRFTAMEVVSTDAAWGWGGVDTDSCKHSYQSLPMEHYIWTCPSCYYSGGKTQFAPKPPATDEFKGRIKGALKPAMTIGKGAKQDQIPGWVKYDLAAQVEVLRGAPTLTVANRHLGAAWAARQAGAVRLDDYDDWLEACKQAGLAKTPRELGKKNRSEEDLEACRRLEKEIEAGKHTGTPLLIRRYVLAATYRRRGENVAALRWLDELDKSRGENSILDDAAKKVRDSIAAERAQQKKAAELFEKAAEDPALDAAEKPKLLYMLGEIARRCGEKEKALAWYDKALAANPADDFKKLIEAQKALAK